MYEYKFKFTKVIDGGTVDGIIDLGFGIFLSKRIKLAGINAPNFRLQSSIKDLKERYKERDRGLNSKKRLKEILQHGSKQPEGLFVETFLDNKNEHGIIFGDIKYVYAKDLYNYQIGEKAWTGWKSCSQQLLDEGLVEIYDKSK